MYNNPYINFSVAPFWPYGVKWGPDEVTPLAPDEK